MTKKAKPAPNTGDSTKTAPAFIGKIAYDNNFGGLRLRSLLLSTITAEAIIRHYITETGQVHTTLRIMEPNRSLQFPEGIPTVIAQSNPINNKGFRKTILCSIGSICFYAQLTWKIQRT
ncbi:MAG: hypothetical protein U0T81_12275 [Saprospiraceae bacterium]